jgi:hypothetical protein
VRSEPTGISAYTHREIVVSVLTQNPILWDLGFLCGMAAEGKN